MQAVPRRRTPRLSPVAAQCRYAWRPAKRVWTMQWRSASGGMPSRISPRGVAEICTQPWARHHAGHTLAFDDTVAWLAVACSKTAVCELMRIAWRTVGAIVARVWNDTEKSIDRCGCLRRIGIDEISYKRHHHYLTVVVDHDSGRLVWAAPGPRHRHPAPVFRRPGRR